MQVYYRPRSVLTDQGEAGARARVVVGDADMWCLRLRLWAFGYQ